MSDKSESGGGPVNCSDSELCIFLAALGEGYCPTYYSDTSQSVQSKSMSIASRSYQHGKKTVAFHGFQSLRMSRNLTDDRGAGLSISLPEDSPARTFPWPEREPESKGIAADCGESLPGSLARFDPASHSWRTAQPSLLGDSEECSVIWPRSGMTVAGQCWELPMSGHRTGATGSGLWVPTPLASNTKANHLRSGGRPSRSYLQWPTPRTPGLDGGANSRKAAKARGMWPTPTSILGTKGGLVTQSKAREGGTLIEAVSVFNDVGVGSQLNPDWVEWLMNWPIGWTSLEALSAREFQHWQTTARTTWFDREAGSGPLIPRVVLGVANRAARLRATGNGQVSMAAATAWRILTAGPMTNSDRVGVLGRANRVRPRDGRAKLGSILAELESR